MYECIVLLEKIMAINQKKIFQRIIITHLNAGLLGAAHLLVEEVVGLEVEHAGGLPLVVQLPAGALLLQPGAGRGRGAAGLLHPQHPVVEVAALWKTLEPVPGTGGVAGG